MQNPYTGLWMRFAKLQNVLGKQMRVMKSSWEKVFSEQGGLTAIWKMKDLKGAQRLYRSSYQDQGCIVW